MYFFRLNLYVAEFDPTSRWECPNDLNVIYLIFLNILKRERKRKVETVLGVLTIRSLLSACFRSIAYCVEELDAALYLLEWRNEIH